MTAETPVPAVSVVLPTHNRAGPLRRAVGSVLEQSFSDLELIVVDDASSDETGQVVGAIADPRLRYVRLDRNVGAPAARNAGIAAARGRLIAFQDSDDEWMPGKLERQVAALQAGDAGDVAFCAFLRTDGRTARRVPGAGLRLGGGDLLPRLLGGNIVSTQTLLVPRDRLEEVGGFDERLGRFQDWDLAIRLATVARYHYVNDPLVVIHDTPGNITANDAAGAAALEIMLGSHAALYDRQPGAKASALRGLGHLHCLAGDMPAGRRQFLRSLAIRPLAPRTVMALMISLFGIAAYRLASTTRRGRRDAHADTPAALAASRPGEA